MFTELERGQLQAIRPSVDTAATGIPRWDGNILEFGDVVFGKELRRRGQGM